MGSHTNTRSTGIRIPLAWWPEIEQAAEQDKTTRHASLLRAVRIGLNAMRTTKEEGSD